MVAESEKQLQQSLGIICIMVPVVVLWVLRAWWVGLLAIPAYAVLAVLFVPITLTLCVKMPKLALTIAYIIPPIKGVVVIGVGLLVF